jgi:hypothetical protein
VRPPRRARHCPKAIRAHGARRRPGTTPSQHNHAAGDADRDHVGDAVEGAQRGQAQTAVAGPPSGAGRTCQRRASRACARRRRRSRRRRSCVPPPGAARRCRAGVVMKHSEQVGPPSLSSSVSAQQSRLVGAVLAEQQDEWAESRGYLGFDVLCKSRYDQTPAIRTGSPPGGTDRLNHPNRRIRRLRRTPRPST